MLKDSYIFILSISYLSYIQNHDKKLDLGANLWKNENSLVIIQYLVLTRFVKNNSWLFIFTSNFYKTFKMPSQEANKQFKLYKIPNQSHKTKTRWPRHFVSYCIYQCIFYIFIAFEVQKWIKSYNVNISVWCSYKKNLQTRFLITLEWRAKLILE